MSTLQHSSVVRFGPNGHGSQKPTDKVTASSGGESGVYLSTRIPWGTGASSVAIRIGPQDFGEFLFSMLSSDPRALHDAYVRVAKFMPDALIRQATREPLPPSDDSPPVSG